MAKRKKKAQTEEKPVEEKETPKENNHRILKIITGVLAVSSVALACYSLVSVFISDSSSEEDYINIQGKSHSETERKFAEFASSDAQKSKKGKLKDVAVIGNRLFLSESKITPSLYDKKHDASIASNDYSGMALYELTKDTVNHQISFSASYSFDLSTLDVGDYLVFPTSKDIPMNNQDRYPYSLPKERTMKETFYSLPDKDGERKKISLLGNKATPYFVIRVEETGTVLPSDYYDCVIYRSFYKQEDGELKPLDPIDENTQALYTTLAENISSKSHYKVKAVTSLNEAFTTKATLAVGFSDTLSEDYASVYTASNYVNFSTKVLEDTELVGYDSFPEIRELTGRVSMEGESYSSVMGNDVLYPTESVIGKESFLLKTSQSEDSETRLSSLLREVNGKE